jgi:hypothetical protein
VLLAVPSPLPSPISVNVNVAPDTALDTYTGVLAAATIALAVFTVLLAVIGWRALRWQRREIEHMAAQLQLAQSQLAATEGQLEAMTSQALIASAERSERRRAALPLLEVAEVAYNAEASQVDVVYAGGTEPAFNVKVWLRLAVPERPHVLQGGEILQAMTAGRSPTRISVTTLADDRIGEGPFAELNEPRIALLDNESWTAVTWRSADGTPGRWGFVQRLRGRQEMIWA